MLEGDWDGGHCAGAAELRADMFGCGSRTAQSLEARGVEKAAKYASKALEASGGAAVSNISNLLQPQAQALVARQLGRCAVDAVQVGRATRGVPSGSKHVNICVNLTQARGAVPVLTQS